MLLLCLYLLSNSPLLLAEKESTQSVCKDERGTEVDGQKDKKWLSFKLILQEREKKIKWIGILSIGFYIFMTHEDIIFS